MPDAVIRTRKLTPRMMAGGAAAVVVLVFGLAAAPWPPKLSGSVTGDAALAERVLTPLALQETFAPVTAENLPDAAPTGRSAAGRPERAWTANGTAPAGGIRSTAADLVRYARAQLDGTAPGAAALEPQWDDGSGGRYGLAWITEEHGGREITWHNGQTGGFWSMVALDRESGRAVVMLSNVSAGHEEAAFELLTAGAK